MTPNPDLYEKLGAFYLGREFDLATAQLQDSLIMYDSKDLTTHALCVGMTGSGKTGLCLALLEEAAIDGIPAIALDPKGDLANLLLTFPELRGEDFLPWLEASEAARKGVTLQELADQRAKQWREGLAAWGQTPERIAKFRQSVDINIFTPGSSAGIPLTVLKGFDPPPESLRRDSDLLGAHLSAAASGLLALLGITADPLTSSEHILLSSILQHAWMEGRSVPIGDLIGFIQSPPFDRIGVLPVDSFMPAAERTKLSLRLNNLLASPAFTAWLQGEPLNIQKLLYTEEGKPRLSIISIAHLSDSERMFFVTRLLSELLAWTRTQSGTSSLRAMFYMDEVAGYFPPVSNPPSKGPMLTLLKQARAFGLGITLATQNPVDLDYKGLSNIGTWFLGRLQTERDKQRVLEGLEGAALQGGQPFDRPTMERTLASLGNRVFLLHNVHEDHPRVFQSRWALSFLAGPLARNQIAQLMEPKKSSQISATSRTSKPTPSASASSVVTEPTLKESPPTSYGTKPSRPIVPVAIPQRFVSTIGYAPVITEKTHYSPALLGSAQLHFVKAGSSIDLWQDVNVWIACCEQVPSELWDAAEPVDDWHWQVAPDEGASFDPLPTDLINPANYKRWTQAFKEHLFRNQKLLLYACPLIGAIATSGMSEADARIELGQKAREARDAAIEKLRAKYSKLEDGFIKRLQSAKERVDREKAQFDHASWSTVLEVGSSILGGLFGNKRSRITGSRGVSAARSVSRASQQRTELQTAEAGLEELRQQIVDLNEQAKQEVNELTRQFDPANLPLETIEIPPRKGDLKVEPVSLIWVPTTRN